MTNLKSVRVSKQLTQREAAKELGISLRSYVSYENDPEKKNTIKYNSNINNILEKINSLITADNYLIIKNKI